MSDAQLTYEVVRLFGWTPEDAQALVRADRKAAIRLVAEMRRQPPARAA